jgi:homogentisate solanesyltransferase
MSISLVVLLLAACSSALALHQTPLFRVASKVSAPVSLLSVRQPLTRLHSTVTEVDNKPADEGILSKMGNALKIMYKFSRPHTIKGTILASVMGVTRALIENPSAISLKLVPRAITGLTALLCGNAYIVGINQIYDVKIDEINKPFLPIAAKMLSAKNAWMLVWACLFTGISIVKTQFSPLIFSLYMLGVVFGTAYSVPPVQLKRFPLLAGGIIATVRGFLLNFGVYYAVREALGIPFNWNPVVAFISSFMTVFATVIAVTKDLPDVEGDIKYNITTFASKFGVKKIAAFAATVLATTYGFAISLPFILPGVFNAWPMTLGHLGLLTYFLVNYSKLDATSMTSIKQFYKAIWNLFYLEYCLYPFI